MSPNHRIVIAVAIALAALSTVAIVLTMRARRASAVPRPITGGLYSVVGDDAGNFSVIKVLAVDPDGVHVSMYKNKFAARPARVVETSLEFGRITDPDPGGIMHVPLSHAAYARLKPAFIQQSTVTQSELELVAEWRDGGGYWP